MTRITEIRIHRHGRIVDAFRAETAAPPLTLRQALAREYGVPLADVEAS